METQLKIFFVIIALLFSINSFAQDFWAIYEYDANGNRVSVQTVYMIDDDNDNKSSKVQEPIMEELLLQDESSIDVAIFPNPTMGKITIELINATKDIVNSDKNGVFIWDINGKMIKEIRKIDSITEINTSGLNDGVYIFQIKIQDSLKTYRVIKH